VPTETPAKKWVSFGGDDELQVLEDGPPLHTRTSNAGISRQSRAPSPASGQREHTAQAPANSSGPMGRIGRAVLSDEEQHAVKLSKMRIELQETRAKILGEKIELEVLFGGRLGA
jgi:hypothetical protein